MRCLFNVPQNLKAPDDDDVVEFKAFRPMQGGTPD